MGSTRNRLYQRLAEALLFGNKAPAFKSASHDTQAMEETWAAGKVEALPA